MPPQRATEEELRNRFWSRVRKGGLGDCWGWTAGKTMGYGTFEWRGRTVRSHRVAYEISNGPIPRGMYVLHSCDNRLCCNPTHLFLGSHLDNVRDAVAKGRHNHGQRVWSARLSPHDVVAIRRLAADGVNYRWISGKFGVSRSHVSAIVHHRFWRGLTVIEPPYDPADVY